MPSILYMVLKKPSKTNWQFYAIIVNLCLCVFVFVAGTIGAVRGIIIDASSYGVFE